jgi:nuclease HARBI1
VDELLDMVETLGLPDLIYIPSRYVFDPVEAFCLTLARFLSVGDQYELSMLYDQSQSAISKIVHKVVTMVDKSWQQILDFDHDHLLSPENLQKYAEAIHQAGAPLETV